MKGLSGQTIGNLIFKPESDNGKILFFRKFNTEMYLGRLGKEENGNKTFDILSLKWGYYSRGNVEQEARGTHSYLGFGEIKGY